MPTLFRTAAAATAVLALAGNAYAEPAGAFIQQQIDGLTDTWRQAHDVVEEGIKDWWSLPSKDSIEDIAKDWWPFPIGEQDEERADGFLKAFTHPAFPEYSMRYKHPDLCDSSVKQISGYLDVDSDKHFFFWFFESRNKPEEDPLVLWLNGGPGCSSLTGLFAELGPCMVNEAGDDTILNEYSWNKNSSIIFLDQPLNVGYSYGSGGARNSVAAAKDVYAFLQLFFKEFSQYSTLDFHIAGESYAGHYIPAIGGELNRNNKGSYSFNTASLTEYASTLAKINLKSLLVGNGLTDPKIQYKYYSKMACENSYGPVLDQSTCDAMDRQYPACKTLIENCYSSQNVFSCLPAAMKCNKDQIQPYQATGMNPYDVRKECTGGNLCYDILGSVQKYLNRPEVMKAIGAQVDKYESCNMAINFQFNMAGDWMRPYVNEVAPLLEDGIRILIYAGDADYICNWMGNKEWTIALPWSGHEEFAAAEDTEWISTTAGEQGGELRRTKDGRFAFLRVFDSGHMVPMDRGDYAIDMLNDWLHEKLA
ncbi:carboxypeptidase y precursor [Lichtheimia corymbifera JMRC:FSU:9682]|uniref:Carboxypeptidase n=1 Tax=Lichtheimia corymbifera JMRC:FSU:9682 TaxID=1263082 RepID=A0A068SET1_9FUNG|nr:carboxypeptidase y precursor [Lichtheimia corymbifera JMRC:FSU:9682]